MSDTRTYARTLTKLELLNPVEILVPLGSLSGLEPGCGAAAGSSSGSSASTLYRDMKEVCPGAAVTQVQRKYFSEARGLAEIREGDTDMARKVIGNTNHISN